MTPPLPIDAIDLVHTALTGLAEALETGQPDRVLAAERPLADAAAALATVDRRAPADPSRLRARLLEARLALDRCRTLGQTSADLISAMWPAETGYGASGQRQTRSTPPPTVNSQV
jgi:hypothetical protein